MAPFSTAMTLKEGEKLIGCVLGFSLANSYAVTHYIMVSKWFRDFSEALRAIRLTEIILIRRSISGQTNWHNFFN